MLIMKCVLDDIHREPQECIEDKCYFWDKERGKCKWLTKKSKP